MATNTNVTVGKPNVTGAVYYAPITATLPTSTSAELGDSFTALGYVSEDGLVNSNSADNSAIKAWGGDTVLEYQTDKTDTFKFALLEALDVNVLTMVYGSTNVSGTISNGVTINVNGSEAEYHAWVFDMVLRGGVKKRIVVPCAKVTALDDITYSDDSAVMYGVTISALYDEDGNSHYEYLKG